MARLLIETADREGDFALLQAEFWLYAARNPQFVEAIAARMRESRAALRALVAETLDEHSAAREATATAVYTVVAALFDGLVRQRRLDPRQHRTGQS